MKQCVVDHIIVSRTDSDFQSTIAQDERMHGAMLVPIISGSDKTTVSVATGHQEYHPVYESPGVITNTARCAHGNAVLPVAFLPIPKSSPSFFASIYVINLVSLCSEQAPTKAPRISKFCPADVSHVPSPNFCTTPIRNDCPRGCPLPRRSFQKSNLYSWAIYR